MRKKNCWEVLNCGRQPGGHKEKELGVCPAAIEYKFNKVNHGVNTGRFCWVIAGTFCNNEIQGSFAQKKVTCLECEFFKKVRDEEGEEFVFDNVQLKMVKTI